MNVPGVIESVVAPDVVQLSVLLAPSVMLVGFAVNELIDGWLGCVTVTVAVAVADARGVGGRQRVGGRRRRAQGHRAARRSRTQSSPALP